MVLIMSAGRSAVEPYAEHIEACNDCAPEVVKSSVRQAIPSGMRSGWRTVPNWLKPTLASGFRSLMNLGNLGMSGAASLFQSVVGLLMILVTNWAVKKLREDQALY